MLKTSEIEGEPLDAVLIKARFWEAHAGVPVNDRQRAMLNRLLDGFTGKLTTSKWAKLAKCSQDSALRDIGDLVGRGILVREEAGGRSTSYRVGSVELRRGGEMLASSGKERPLRPRRGRAYSCGIPVVSSHGSATTG